MMRQIVVLMLIIILFGCDKPAEKHAEPLEGEKTNQSQLDAIQKRSDANLKPTGKTSDLDAEATFHLVMLGDSITAGYGLAAPDALPVQLEETLLASGMNIRIINAGVSGDTTKDALNRFDWSVEEKADGVLIALGGNDLLQGIQPAETRQNLEAIITAAQSRDLQVLLAGMKAPGNYGLEFQQEFDDVFPALAAQYDLPFYPFLLDGVAQDPALNQRDGIHPNKEGVAHLINGLAPFIAEGLQP